jgi:hypothetical protein
MENPQGGLDENSPRGNYLKPLGEIICFMRFFEFRYLGFKSEFWCKPKN